MQAFTVAFSRVSRSAFSANPELKSQITDLVDRAYFNLHNQSLATADSQWANAIIATALQLCMDARVAEFSQRDLVHLFENIIRISEEHLREARRHAAMANNVFYLKETALDASLTLQSAFNDTQSTVVGMPVSHTGRVRTTKPSDA
jgi:methylphosphotriester-DNA--protein-cysteine methyltransferase